MLLQKKSDFSNCYQQSCNHNISKYLIQFRLTFIGYSTISESFGEHWEVYNILLGYLEVFIAFLADFSVYLAIFLRQYSVPVHDFPLKTMYCSHFWDASSRNSPKWRMLITIRRWSSFLCPFYYHKKNKDFFPKWLI